MKGNTIHCGGEHWKGEVWPSQKIMCSPTDVMSDSLEKFTQGTQQAAEYLGMQTTAHKRALD